MKKSIGATIAVAALVLAACGSDGDGGASGVQGEAADAAMAAGTDAGFGFDEACVNDLAKQLSDADAQAIVDSGGQNSDLSPEGEALSDDLLGCIDNDDLIDQFIIGLTSSGQAVDEDCVREKLEGVDLSQMADDSDLPDEVVVELIECFDLGG
jgi:hypothetical protein